MKNSNIFLMKTVQFKNGVIIYKEYQFKEAYGEHSPYLQLRGGAPNSRLLIASEFFEDMYQILSVSDEYIRIEVPDKFKFSRKKGNLVFNSRYSFKIFDHKGDEI